MGCCDNHEPSSLAFETFGARSDFGSHNPIQIPRGSITHSRDEDNTDATISISHVPRNNILCNIDTSSSMCLKTALGEFDT